MFDRVLVLADFAKSQVRSLAGELETWLEGRVGQIQLETDTRVFCDRRQAMVHEGTPKQAADRPDLVIVLGGDGALLGAVRAFAEDPVPMLGINLGHVGFLASTPASSWRDTLADVLAGTAVIEERMRLCAEWTAADGNTRSAVALNDVTLQRDSHQGMLRASLSVGRHWVTEYRADGLIVATPSGSTAYGLSAGGPILVPPVEALVVTPICSQGLANRSIVLDTSNDLTIRLNSSDGTTALVIDGQAHHALAEGDLVRLQRHPVRYPLFAMRGLDSYLRLRKRLGWGAAPAGA